MTATLIAPRVRTMLERTEISEIDVDEPIVEETPTTDGVSKTVRVRYAKKSGKDL